jgi:tetratricopeptide (TPR) repeat protein
LEAYKKSIEFDRNFADGYLELGRLYYFNENYPNALEAFTKYAELKPGSIEGETYTAKTLYGQKKYDEALQKLDEIVAKNPDADLSSAYKYMAYVYHDKEQFDKSLEYFAKVNPEIIDFEDHIMLAKIYAGKKDYANAYKNIDEAIEHDSTDDNTYYHLGIIQFGEKNYAAAIASFDKSISLGSQQIATYVYKGLSLYSLQKYDDAIKEFNTAISLDNGFVQAWLWKARSEVQLEKFEDAKVSYKKVLEFDPGNQSAIDDMKLIESK